MTRKSVGIFNQLADGTWELQTDQGTFMGCSKDAAYSKWYRKNGPRTRFTHKYSEFADGSVILHHPTLGNIPSKSRSGARANLRRMVKNGVVPVNGAGAFNQGDQT